MRVNTSGEVFPGDTAPLFPGHTQGPVGYRIASVDRALLIWGDIVRTPEVQVRRPEVTMVVDVDPAEALATRRRVFDDVAADRFLVTGMHLHYPGLDHIARDGAGYRLVPEPWAQQM